MNPIPELNKQLYWPICRAYARYVIGDRPSDIIQRILCSFQFWQTHRSWPDFVHPRSFSEKIWRRMLFERSPILTQLSDKLQVREYVANKVGSEYLIPLLWRGDDPGRIPFDELPDRFVIKTNHGCGYNIIVRNKADLNPDKVKRQLNEWLNENFCMDRFLGVEWGYKNIEPAVLIESFLEEDGKVPKDYKLWCFSGRVECISVHFDRHTRHTVQGFDRSFNPIDFGIGQLPLYAGKFQKPKNFEKMLNVAEILAEGFDFIRVDLYSLPTNVLFGELTFYPFQGLAEYGRSWELVLGKKWKGV